MQAQEKSQGKGILSRPRKERAAGTSHQVGEEEEE